MSREIKSRQCSFFDKTFFLRLQQVHGATHNNAILKTSEVNEAEAGIDVVLNVDGPGYVTSGRLVNLDAVSGSVVPQLQKRNNVTSHPPQEKKFLIFSLL
jgi:hypothetical protein